MGDDIRHDTQFLTEAKSCYNGAHFCILLQVYLYCKYSSHQTDGRYGTTLETTVVTRFNEHKMVVWETIVTETLPVATLCRLTNGEKESIQSEDCSL